MRFDRPDGSCYIPFSSDKLELVNAMKNIILCLALLPLTACALIWGTPYKVTQVNPTSITLNYTPADAHDESIQNAAQAHCDQYGKDAVPGAAAKNSWGVISQTFKCGKRAPL